MHWHEKRAKLFWVLLIIGIVAFFQARLLGLPASLPPGEEDIGPGDLSSEDSTNEEVSSPHLDAGPEAIPNPNTTDESNREELRLTAPLWMQLSLLVPDIVPPTEIPREEPGVDASVESGQSVAEEAQLTLQMFLKKLTWQERVMVLRTLTKFSPTEMLEVFRLYKQGSLEAYRSLDAIIMRKVGEEEFEWLRSLAQKYR